MSVCACAEPCGSVGEHFSRLERGQEWEYGGHETWEHYLSPEEPGEWDAFIQRRLMRLLDGVCEERRWFWEVCSATRTVVVKDPPRRAAGRDRVVVAKGGGGEEEWLCSAMRAVLLSVQPSDRRVEVSLTG